MYGISAESQWKSNTLKKSDVVQNSKMTKNDSSPASYFLCLPQAWTVVGPQAGAYDHIWTGSRHQWSSRFDFPKFGTSSTSRDRFALLFVQLLLSDPGIQLLPFDPDLTLNPITVTESIS